MGMPPWGLCAEDVLIRDAVPGFFNSFLCGVLSPFWIRGLRVSSLFSRNDSAEHRKTRMPTVASIAGNLQGNMQAMSMNVTRHTPSQRRSFPSSDGQRNSSRSLFVPGQSTQTAQANVRVIDPDQNAKVQMKSLMKKQFGDVARDQTKFHDTMRKIFGKGYDFVKAEAFRQKALKGDFSWLPPIKFASNSDMRGANGAYDAKSGSVYINDKLKNDPSLAASTYVEEAGHHLDTKLNKTDTPGDEGEMFRRVLGGEKLSKKQLATIRNENDKGTILVNGKEGGRGRVLSRQALEGRQKSCQGCLGCRQVGRQGRFARGQ